MSATTPAMIRTAMRLVERNEAANVISHADNIAEEVLGSDTHPAFIDLAADVSGEMTAREISINGLKG
jgi:bacterioferritin (cytochrome b1)